MPTPHLVLSNQSSYAASEVPLRDIAHAITRQLEDFAQAWGEITWMLVDDLRRQGFQVVLFDTSDQADALAYHDVTPKGRPYASVFCKTILDNDGTWTKGANSVSAATSHEVVELLADPVCNRYAVNAGGDEFALETADATENDSYDIEGIAVSNFLYPSYFNPFAKATRRNKLDHMGVVEGPFSLRPGGYTIRHRGGRDTTVWGDEYPTWKRAAKKAAAHSRTSMRARLLTGSHSRVSAQT
jgi:hypothetical protein